MSIDRMAVIEAQHTATVRAQRAYDAQVAEAARRRNAAVDSATKARDQLWNDLRNRLAYLRCTRPRTPEVEAQIAGVQAEMATWRDNPPKVQREDADAEYEGACQISQEILRRRVTKIRAAARAGDLDAINHA